MVHQVSELSVKPAPTRRTSSSAISRDPTLRRQAVAALATHGSMALAMLDKYAPDPDFREILRTHGAAVIPAIAQADAGTADAGLPGCQARGGRSPSRWLWRRYLPRGIMVRPRSGRSRMMDWNESPSSIRTQIQFYQFLPLYDVIHLGNVVGRGYSPTSSEMTWALVDGCFVIADALSLAAVQPEGAVARRSRSAPRSRPRCAKGLDPRAASSRRPESSPPAGPWPANRACVGLNVPSAAGTAAMSQRWARWWTVRSAGGLYQIMRQIPEALPRLSLAQMADMARPLAAKAGMRLSAWKPIRLLKDGKEVLLSIPPQRGLKYLSAQAVQAGVGRGRLSEDGRTSGLKKTANSSLAMRRDLAPLRPLTGRAIGAWSTRSTRGAIRWMQRRHVGPNRPNDSGLWRSARLAVLRVPRSPICSDRPQTSIAMSPDNSRIRSASHRMGARKPPANSEERAL